MADSEHAPDRLPMLVTGATGYIGGQLVPVLLERGYRVRVLTRSADRLRSKPWSDQVEIIEGDAGDEADLARALAGVGVAYYLLHSMDGQGDFVERDRTMARTFAKAAKAAGLRRLVYLSGLHPVGKLSAHLASRVEVGQILLDSGVPTIVLQAGVVVGAGSASFDMLRHLTERMPAMVAPKWLRNRIQPIVIDDVLHYLAGAASAPGDPNRTFDIGGPEVLTYAEMIKRYAKVTGLGGRAVATVPVLTPQLASYWVALVTPVRSGIARPLVGSLVHEAIVKEQDIISLVGEPPNGSAGFDDAVRRATANIDPTRWRRTAVPVALCTIACAGVGSILTNPDSQWYRQLRKPAWQPPASVFPVVWTTIFTAIALAATAAITELEESDRPDDANAVKAAYLTNLALNTAWSGLFFRGHRLSAAAGTAGLLALSATDLARRVAPVGKGKAGVFGAYAAWSCFATLLTVAIRRRNPGAA